MKLFLRKNIFILFWVIAIADIVGLALNVPIVHLIFKPLLMPVLILAVLILSDKTAGRKKIVGALFFAFLGDVFLLFQDKTTMFFILGLSYFLVTHIFYITYFIQKNKHEPSPLKKYPYLILLIALYTVSLLYFLIPRLGDLKIPVAIYACVISAMLYFSLGLPDRIGKMTRYFFIGGAFCFVISDSLLAIDKFYMPFYFAAILVMLTYCFAQYLIVKGFIRNRD
jgi:uncharacterized membrane protein YhhN